MGFIKDRVKINRNFLILLFVFLIIAAVVLDKNKNNLQTLFEKYILKTEQLEEVTSLSPTTGRVNSPPALRKSQPSASVLTAGGIIKLTNVRREENNLAPLTINPKLMASALSKAQDMLDKQYFEHDSPDGIGASDLAADAGYSYIIIGENLAVGNFLDDAALVQGWMDSPGHRDNILHPKYQDIGVAVVKGTFEGRDSWMAVQHFGLSTDACPAVDYSLKNTITKNELKLSDYQKTLTALKSEIESMNEDDPNYNSKVQQYNSLVSAYNSLLESTKALITKYNSQVSAFNACAG